MIRRSLSIGGAGLATAALVLAALVAPTSASPTATSAALEPPRSAGGTDGVRVADVLTHLAAFDRIAGENGGNRAAGTPGYEASAAYVEAVLRDAGYQPQRQSLTVHEQTIETESATVTGGAPALHANAITFTPGTDADGETADLVAPGDPLGCDATAWQGVAASGGIALVSRGACGFAVKAQAAHVAGAVAMVVYNNDEDEDAPLSGSFARPVAGTVPSVGVSRAEGDALLAALAAGPVEMTVLVVERTSEVPTFNVVAETGGGRADNVVLLGAHLDSVATSPGVNDNGSGSASILATAVALAGSTTPPANKVRFAWWGAEELGLHGSNAYVAGLDEAEVDDLAAYLNFDMVASPNHIIGVYDADQSTYESPVDVPPGSTALEDLLTDHLDAADQPWIDVPFDGRSDYWAFIEAGIPATGLFTGAEQSKTEQEATLFGGVAGEPYDPHYHEPGDDLTNVSEEALAITVPAIAHLATALAADTWSVNGVARPTTTTLRLSRSRAVRGGPPVRAVAQVAGASDGTVRFRDGRRLVGAVTLREGRARLTLTKVRSLGRHRITASFVATERELGSRDSGRLRVVRGR